MTILPKCRHGQHYVKCPSTDLENGIYCCQNDITGIRKTICPPGRYGTNCESISRAGSAPQPPALASKAMTPDFSEDFDQYLRS